MKIFITFLMLCWMIGLEAKYTQERIKLLEHRVAELRWDVDDHNDRLKRFEEGD